MARTVIKSINWTALSERVPEHQRNALAVFKTKSEQYLRRLAVHPETPPQIDWEFYRKNVITPGLVDKFKKEYESLQIPYPQDKYTSLFDSEEKELIPEIEKLRKECESVIEKENVEIANIKAIMPYDQMTLQEFVEYHPECDTGTVFSPSIWPHTEELKYLEDNIEEIERKEIEEFAKDYE